MPLGSGHQRYFLLPFFLFGGEFSLEGEQILNLFYVLPQILRLRILQLDVLLVAVEDCLKSAQIFQMACEMVLWHRASRLHSSFSASISFSCFELVHWTFS